MKENFLGLMLKHGEETVAEAFRAAVKELHAQQRADARALAAAAAAKGLTLARVLEMLEAQEASK